MCVGGQGVYGKPLYLPLNFALNLKLLLKKVLVKNRSGTAASGRGTTWLAPAPFQSLLSHCVSASF